MTPGPGVLGSFEFIVATETKTESGAAAGYVDAVGDRGEKAHAGRLHGVEEDSWHCYRTVTQMVVVGK